MIGVRLHALIIAARFGIPFLAVPYDPKITALMADLQYPLQPLWTPGTRPAIATIDGLTDDIWSRRTELAAHLATAAAAQRQRAEQNFTVLERLVRA